MDTAVPPATCPLPYWHACALATDPDARRRRARWAFVRAAACISLQERPDRAKRAAAEFGRVGLDGRVVFYRPPKDRSRHLERPGRRGCYESHRAIARAAWDADLEHVLVLEDDVVFRRASDADVLAVRDALERMPKGWRLLHLGHMPWIAVPARPDLRVVRAWSYHTHAYFMSRTGMRWLLDRPYDPPRGGGRPRSGSRSRDPPPIDQRYSVMRGVYAMYPMLAGQSESVASDIVPGGQRGFSRWMEATLRNPKHEILRERAALFGPPAIIAVATALVLVAVALVVTSRTRGRSHTPRR